MSIFRQRPSVVHALVEMSDRPSFGQGDHPRSRQSRGLENQLVMRRLADPDAGCNYGDE